MFKILFADPISPEQLGLIINHLRENLTRCLFYEHNNAFVDLGSGRIIIKFTEPGTDSAELTHASSWLEFKDPGEKSPKEISCSGIESQFWGADEFTSYLKEYKIDDAYIRHLTNGVIVEDEARVAERMDIQSFNLEDFLATKPGRWSAREVALTAAKKDPISK